MRRAMLGAAAGRAEHLLVHVEDLADGAIALRVGQHLPAVGQPAPQARHERGAVVQGVAGTAPGDAEATAAQLGIDVRIIEQHGAAVG